ncbi:MAG: GNAT family N-acetyltransferase [Cyanobacteria bacterium P01_A01_bin.3]
MAVDWAVEVMHNNPTNFPRLATSRLILRAIAPADAAAYGELLSDETEYPYITDSGPVSAAQISERICRTQKLFVQGRAIYWALEYQASFIGHVALHDPNKPTPALSYAVRRQWRRRGFATEAIAAVCRYTFSALGSRELVAHTHLDNGPSASLLVQLGFRHRGVVSVTDGERNEFRLTAA